MVRLVKVSPPSAKYFSTTIEYLYVGSLPVSACESGDVLFGMLANAHYLSCERLIKMCLDHLKTVLKGNGYKPFTSNGGFNSSLVPVALLKEVVGLSRQDPAYKSMARFKRLDILLDWLDKETEGTKEGEAVARECESILSSDFMQDTWHCLLGSVVAPYTRMS